MYLWMVIFYLIAAVPAPYHLAVSLLPCTIGPDPEPTYSSGLLVNCSNKGLNQIPQGVPSETTTLLLANNNLTQIRNDTFRQLTDLRKLDLSRNSISSLQPNAFWDLEKLVELNLWDNELVLSPKTYPVEVFKPLRSLRTLVLSMNARRVVETPETNVRATGERPFFGTDHVLKFEEKNMRQTTTDNEYSSFSRKLGDASLPNKLVKTSGGVKRTKADRTNVTNIQDEELGYPDEALSHLVSLRYLSIDGLTNKTLGRGFSYLTQLTHLEMNGKTGHCKLVTFNRTTLANLPNITHLNLSDCNILNLTQDAFSSLENLKALDLSFNQALGFDLLGEAVLGLSRTMLKNLTIDSIVPSRSLGVIINPSQLRFFRNLTHLEKLQARFNRIEAFEDGALCSGMPPKLKHINMNGNLFEMAPYINDLECLESVEELNVNGLNAHWIPPLRPPHAETVHSRSSCRSQVFKRETLRQNTETEMSQTWHGGSVVCLGNQFSVPPNLKIFTARDFGLTYKLEKVRVKASNSLKRLDLSENHFPVLEGRLCGFENVTELHLTDTLTFYIFNKFFSDFTNLQFLNISGNRLRHVFWDNKGEIFDGLKNLKVLDISRNDLGHIPNETFIHLENLEELYLRVNGIATLDIIVSHMKKLRHLDISKNQLHTLPKSVRDHLDQVAGEGYHVSVNMTYNPIACICQNIDFLRWIRESEVDFGTTRDNEYYCQQPDGSIKLMKDVLATIDQLERTCGSFVGVFIGASACCVTVVVVLLVALTYRFRWKLRYLYYASRLGLQRHRQQERQQEFHYDAFVSFASEDNRFVNGELRQQLEDQQGLSLCIHTRDFMPGQYIASNIVDSVQRSRRTLVVLTRALLDSDWCHYELQMALMESVHSGRDILLFLLYEHVPAHELSRDMLANLQATSYIEFPHCEQNRDLFWSRVAQALKA